MSAPFQDRILDGAPAFTVGWATAEHGTHYPSARLEAVLDQARATDRIVLEQHPGLQLETFRITPVRRLVRGSRCTINGIV